MRSLRLAILALCLTLQCFGAAHAGPGRFRTVQHHVVEQITPVGSSATYDTRYGTDSPTTITANKGLFTFLLHSGNHEVWVDSLHGNDANTCLSLAQVCAGFDRGFTVFNATFTTGGGDHLMVAGGESQTYLNHANATSGYMANKGGISAAYPTVIESYDSTDPTNTALYGNLRGNKQPTIRLDGVATYGNSFSNNCSGCTDAYVAVKGITFDGQDIAANAITWQGKHDGLIFQNNRWGGVELSINGSSGSYDATATSYTQGVNISQNSFWSQWASDGNDAGCYVQRTNQAYIQDNVFGHAGWRVGSARDDQTADGGPSFLGHGCYTGAINANMHIDRMLGADSPQDSYNNRGNGTGTSIAVLDDPISGNVGDISGNLFLEAPTGVLNQTTEWLGMGGADIGRGQPRAQGPWMTNDITGSFIRNAAFFDNPLHSNGSAHFVTDYSSQSFIPTAITHSGTTATVTVAGHGFTTGQPIACDHASPTDYNEVNQPITVIDANTFTYPLATTPATNVTNPSATVCTPQVPSFMLMDKIRTFNYSSALLGVTASTNVMNNINLTFTDTISDQLAPGAGNQVASAGLFPNYKTRDQVITAVLNGVGITPGANYYVRKGQLINAALTRPDLPWSQWLIGVGFPAMGLTPTYTTPAFQTFTDTPLSIYKTTLTDLTLSDNTFVHGVSKTVLLSGVSALPVLSSSDLPSGCSLSGRALTCNAVSSGTPTIHIVENSQDGTATSHTTPLTLNISFLPLFAWRRRKRKPANDNRQMEMAA